MTTPTPSFVPALSDEAFERFVRLVRRQLAVPTALVSLVGAEEQVFPGAVGLPEPWQSDRRTPLTHSFCKHVVASTRPLVVEDARREPLVAGNLAVTELDVVAYAGMPLVDVDGRVIGSLCAIDSRPRHWTDDDLAVLVDLAAACSSELQLRALRERAARAAEVAAVEWHRTQQLLEERTSVAATLQRAMLTHLPRPATLEVAARYLPAHALDQVGGDWYDAFSSRAATVLAMGDTAGHDITAAADMGQLRTLLRGYAVDRDEAPSQTVARLDRALEKLHVDTLATIVLAHVEPDPAVPGQHALRWTSAGHPPPLLLLADGSVQVLAARPDLVVGVDASRPRTDHTAVLPPGSTLLLYTDGLIERRADGRSIDAGTERLVGCLRDLAGRPLEELLDALVEQLGDGRDDDIAVLAVRGRPVPAAR